MDIIARILNFSLMIAMPLALGVYLVRKLKLEWRVFGLGALTFIGSQVLHIPFNAWVLAPAINNTSLAGAKSGLPLIFIALLYGLSAGVFEEVARYLVYRFKLKEDRSWRKGMLFGAGHGGIESIILGGLVLATFFQILALRGVDLSTVVGPDQIDLAQAQIDAYWSAPWYAALLGAVERAAAICFHLSASILVLQVFTRRNILWLGAAISWHTLIDAFAVYGVQSWGIYITEAIILGAGALSLVLVFWFKKASGELMTPADQELTKDISTPIVEIHPLEPSNENIEDSRYV
jgi:uncharacterized membrane protein YhfC